MSPAGNPGDAAFDASPRASAFMDAHAADARLAPSNRVLFVPPSPPPRFSSSRAVCNSCAASRRSAGIAEAFDSRPPPWQSALKLAPTANLPRSIATSPSARRRRAEGGSGRPAAARFSHQLSTARAYASAPDSKPATGRRLLVRVSLFRSAAPSHSRFGGRSATSARRAAAWHEKWMALKWLTLEYPALDAPAKVLDGVPPPPPAAAAPSTRLQKQYTPRSSRGRDLYPSRHTRHTSAPSSSSSSERSSNPSMDPGDTATASMSLARPGLGDGGQDPRDPVGVEFGGVEDARGVVAPETALAESSPPAGLSRVRPISRSIRSRRSIAFRILSARVARRNASTATRASSYASSNASSAFSAAVPTPCSAVDSRACSSSKSVRGSTSRKRSASGTSLAPGVSERPSLVVACAFVAALAFDAALAVSG